MEYNAKKTWFLFCVVNDAVSAWEFLTGEKRLSLFIKEGVVPDPESLVKSIFIKRMEDYPFNILISNLSITWIQGGRHKLIPLMVWKDIFEGAYHEAKLYLDSNGRNESYLEMVCPDKEDHCPYWEKLKEFSSRQTSCF